MSMYTIFPRRTPVLLAIKFAFTLIAICALHSSIAAQTVSFVSGTGHDGNPCSRTAPCRSMQRGINATPAGGELQVLESAGYGPNVVIDKSITISGLGVQASIMTPSGNGITIAAGANDVVVLRGLLLDGVTTGGDGIQINSAGTVQLERIEVERYAGNGILYNTNGELYIRDSISRSNGVGGIVLTANGGTAKVSIDGCRIEDNGPLPSNPTSVADGLDFEGGTVEATVSNTIAAGNQGNGFEADGANIRINFTNCTSTKNGNVGFGIQNGAEMNIEYSVAHANVGSGFRLGNTGGTMRVSNSASTNNGGAGFIRAGFGNLFESRGNNIVRGNATDIVGTIVIISGI